MPYIGRLGSLGIAKETAVGTVNTTPDNWLAFLPPESISPDIKLLEHGGIFAKPDSVFKATQGAASIPSAKFKLIAEPENIGEILMGALGTDTAAETPGFTVVSHTVFTVTLNVNNSIDFKESVAGTNQTATLTAGTYTAYDLAAEIKTQMETANGTAVTYTVTFNSTTRKFTITPNSGTVQLLWLSGTANAKGAYALIGWAKVDTDAAASQTSTSAVTFAAANDAIPFTEGAGTEKTAYLTAGTYALGLTSATAGTLCALIKTVMDLANGTTDTYTVTYSYSTKKLTITNNTEVFVFRWTTGVNAGISAMSLLGFAANSSSATSATSDSTTSPAVFTHTFTRLSSAQLPTYSFYVDKGGGFKKMLFAGAMLNKLTLEAKAKEYVTADADFACLKYDSDGTGTQSYSILKPFTFNEVSVNFAGSGTELDYDNIKIEIDNQVKMEHSLSGSIWANKIWSEGFKVTVAADFYVEDSVEYSKYLAGSDTSLVVTITSSEMANGITPYKITLNIPLAKYSAAPLQNTSGVVKIPFSMVGIYDPSTTKTLNAILQNTKVTAY